MQVAEAEIIREEDIRSFVRTENDAVVSQGRVFAENARCIARGSIGVHKHDEGEDERCKFRCDICSLA